MMISVAVDFKLIVLEGPTHSETQAGVQQLLSKTTDTWSTFSDQDLIKIALGSGTSVSMGTIRALVTLRTSSSRISRKTGPS